MFFGQLEPVALSCRALVSLCPGLLLLSQWPHPWISCFASSVSHVAKKWDFERLFKSYQLLDVNTMTFNIFWQTWASCPFEQSSCESLPRIAAVVSVTPPLNLLFCAFASSVSHVVQKWDFEAQVYVYVCVCVYVWASWNVIQILKTGVKPLLFLNMVFLLFLNLQSIPNTRSTMAGHIQAPGVP